MRTLAEVRSYFGAEAFLKGRESRKIAHNTWVRKVDEGVYAIRYHNTDVVTFRRDGRIILNTGGWRTVTTKVRLNVFSPARIWSERRTWKVRLPNGTVTDFYDGINVGKRPYDITAGIIAYETGELDGEGTIELFQRLVDNGMAWTLQGHYGRMATALIEQGLVTLKRAA